MIRHIVDNRHYLRLILTVGIGTLLSQRFPFPDDNAVLQLVQAEKPMIFIAIKYAYQTMLFSTPFIACSMLFSILYIFFVRPKETTPLSQLPPYPNVIERNQLFIVVGELHHPKRPEPVEQPRWLMIPNRGLYTGIAIFGAIGSGKTSCCMHPFAEQILAYRANDPERRPAALVLEVKGDFCHKVRKILKQYRRENDYFEISLDCPYRYNPLHNDLEAYALAYGIASLLNNLFGRGKEPFWQQAYTNLVKFIILLHKVNYDYVTLFDVYECAINPDKLEMKIKEGEQLFQTEEYVLVSDAEYMARRDLTKYEFGRDPATGEVKAEISVELLRYLDQNHIAYSIVTETGCNATASTPDRARKREQLEAVKRWFYHDWRRIEPKLRTSIVEGISVFLSLFDDNPSVKATFCPPKECYDPELNHDGRFGVPMPPFSQLLEQGKVCALNFPVAMNPGLARAIGTLMKQDFQRAVLNRIPLMELEPARRWREILFNLR
jgi:hypothetical protein